MFWCINNWKNSVFKIDDDDTVWAFNVSLHGGTIYHNGVTLYYTELCYKLTMRCLKQKTEKIWTPWSMYNCCSTFLIKIPKY